MIKKKVEFFNFRDREFCCSMCHHEKELTKKTADYCDEDSIIAFSSNHLDELKAL